jgi:hypothetical protein
LPRSPAFGRVRFGGRGFGVVVLLAAAANANPPKEATPAATFVPLIGLVVFFASVLVLIPVASRGRGLWVVFTLIAP